MCRHSIKHVKFLYCLLIFNIFDISFSYRRGRTQGVLSPTSFEEENGDSERSSFRRKPIPEPTNGVMVKEPKRRCFESITKIRGQRQKLCSGDVIFEDNFDNIREDFWQIEHKRQSLDHPEYQFVSYQRLKESPTVDVQGGLLKITPQLQQDQPGFNNESLYQDALNLIEGCTGKGDECFMIPSGSNILPPVVSGRVTLKDFVFMYGEITVRAKFPKGDWLYPELLLEPLTYKYGKKNFASGLIKIASAHGNLELSEKNGNDHSNRVLYGGAFMDFKCHSIFLNTMIIKDDNYWSDAFHDYTVHWSPEQITFSVDAEEWAKIGVGARGLQDHFPEALCPDAPHRLWENGNSREKITPFNDYFSLTLGVAAGGMTDFRDGLYTKDNRRKPWKNLSSKSMIQFWQDLEAWHKTWNEESVLLVDSVKITAI